ncbi:MAG: hypothetical protein KIT25_25660 [Enhydrobacter sp.]|nr:MAG: hypothetical protein KIT25_25660 [Enhydrobacter sp.]
MHAQAAGDGRAESLERLLRARFARQAGLIAAAVAIVISLPLALAENACAMTAAAGSGTVAGTLGASVSMSSIVAMAAAFDHGELAAATGMLAMGAVAGVLVRRHRLAALGCVGSPEA